MMRGTDTKFFNEQKLPLVIESTGNISFTQFLEEIKENSPSIKQNLLQYGGILFRRFPVEKAEGFNAVVEALDLGKPLNYIGGDTPRDKVQGKIYTSTEAPPSFKIPLHNEMSFIKNYPRHIYFYCETPPKEGGETIIADARHVYTGVDTKIREKFENLKLKYVTNFYGTSWLLDLINRFQKAHKSWMDAFETHDKKEVENLCALNEFGYKWNHKNWLQVTYNVPGVIDHPTTGERVWFNQAHLYDYNPRLLGIRNWIATRLLYWKKDTVLHEIFFEDGKKIPKEELYHAMDVLDRSTIKFPWQKGDVLVLDNILTMHGRAAFTGKRRILAALTR